MSRIVVVILIYHRHKPIDSISLFGSLASRRFSSVVDFDKLSLYRVYYIASNDRIDGE
jgi:hypothetical protein